MPSSCVRVYVTMSINPSRHVYRSVKHVERSFARSPAHSRLRSEWDNHGLLPMPFIYKPATVAYPTSPKYIDMHSFKHPYTFTQTQARLHAHTRRLKSAVETWDFLLLFPVLLGLSNKMSTILQATAASAGSLCWHERDEELSKGGKMGGTKQGWACNTQTDPAGSNLSLRLLVSRLQLRLLPSRLPTHVNIYSQTDSPTQLCQRLS
ncbi:unnamed protein product [Protopolystoma xenopodis]|uniref:Uncharacterized protein n=1 Tax=Protopolystoma xenopodis TaxID=117903 RepID=A0A3S5CN35_9PLAT|nr:unnamed protein product [Protopolystoma xenopodis]